MENENLDEFRNFISDIYEQKFFDVKGKARFHNIEKIKNDKRYENSKKIIEKYYYEKGFGIKYFIKYFKLNVSYPVLRKCFLNFFEIKLRSYEEITDNLRKLRREKIEYERENNMGWFSEESRRKTKIRNSIQRGIQGYFFNESRNKFVWLRSSWEYIFAKWLNKNKFDWDVEVEMYNVGGKKYRPDFFIFENSKITKIIEVKGYWKNNNWKFEVLGEQLKDKNIEFILIENILPYCSLKFKDEVETWKLERKADK